MTVLDQFESEFRSAVRTPYVYSPLQLDRGLLVTDLPAPDEHLLQNVQRFLGVGRDGKPMALEFVGIEPDDHVTQLLTLIENRRPDLLVTYRNLHSDAWSWPHSLGDAVDVLTQVTDVPVLLIPNPREDQNYADRLQGTRSVMAITDHLAGDHRLVNYAVSVTEPGGRLVLAHVEDRQDLARVVDAVSKIPAIDTETVKQELPRQLLKEPLNYAASCQEVLREAAVDIEIEHSVSFGHRLKDHLRLVEAREIDLLVLNTKDDDQLAMHGLAYPIAVQLRNTPLLML